MTDPVIYDADKNCRWAKWIMTSMFAVLMGLMAVVRCCGD